MVPIHATTAILAFVAVLLAGSSHVASSAQKQHPTRAQSTEKKKPTKPQANTPPPELVVSPPIRDPERFTRTHVKNWKAIREQNIVMQRHDYSCGAAALATILKYYWQEPISEEIVLLAILSQLDADEIKDRMANGLSITDLRQASEKLGYPAVLGSQPFSELAKAKVPVVIRLVDGDFEHFVVYRGIVQDRVFLADPIRGNLRMPIDKFVHQWHEKGKREGVLLVVAKEGVDELPKNAPLSLRHHYACPVVPELQAARRGLFLHNSDNLIRQHLP